MTIRVHALEDSSDYKPWGDCYAPQVVLSRAMRGFDGHMLNGHMLPFTDGDVYTAYDRFRLSFGSCNPRVPDRTTEVMRRYYRAFYGIEMIHKETQGFSQGDWGHSFVFATPEWLEMTGAPGLRESDHNDFCAWLWGDVYEVFNDDPEDFDERCPGGDVKWPMTLPDGTETHGVIGAVTEKCPMIVYGMDEAMKYGEITYPTHHTYTTYEYND